MTVQLHNQFPIDSILNDVEAIKDKYGAYAFLLHYSRSMGYAHFALHLASGDSTHFGLGTMLVSNIPDAFVAEFDANRLAEQSPVVAAMRATTAPVVWDSETASAARSEADRLNARALLAKHGIEGGVHIPVHNHRDRRGVVIMVGQRATAPSLAEIAELSLVANAVFNRLSIVAPGAAPSAGARLSERERECLVWTAAGKTSAEIGRIIGLSEHTINQYISSCCQKLDAVNRVQAVAVAIRGGLI